MIHICEINQRGSDQRGEWVSVVNAGAANINLTALELTDYTQTQQCVHVYRFPPAHGGVGLVLAPGQTVYVFSGLGTNTRLPDGDLLLFMGRQAPVWNNCGDVAYLRTLDGRFVDTMTVGAPRRHPNGH